MYLLRTVIKQTPASYERRKRPISRFGISHSLFASDSLVGSSAGRRRCWRRRRPPGNAINYALLYVGKGQDADGRVVLLSRLPRSGISRGNEKEGKSLFTSFFLFKVDGPQKSSLVVGSLAPGEKVASLAFPPRAVSCLLTNKVCIKLLPGLVWPALFTFAVSLTHSSRGFLSIKIQIFFLGNNEKRSSTFCPRGEREEKTRHRKEAKSLFSSVQKRQLCCSMHIFIPLSIFRPSA